MISDFTLIVKIYKFWDKYTRNHFVAALSTFRGQILQAAISQIASGWIYLFFKLFIIKLLFTDSLHQKIQSTLYSDFFLLCFHSMS